MFDSFAHYLSYGATDQQTARELDTCYDGLLVPGTVAAFQSEGTRGFVLTLSASRRTRYVIDPRFPLFQQRLPNPKKSHESLAQVLGVPELVNREADPTADELDETRADRIASHWLDFNSGYTTVSTKHFNKYAERLGETILPTDTRGPECVLVPYAMAGSVADPWWSASERLWQAHVSQASAGGREHSLVRVVAAKEASSLDVLLRAVPQERVAIWANALDELDTTPQGLRDLEAYRDAIRSASFTDGKQLFALYGGFFSVLMSQFGLTGASHGIGYGEARTWVELPQSGPPPARYYLPRAHRYVSQDLALYLWREAPELVVCNCLECNGSTPAALDYHGLMRHSVRCRHAEIEEWTRLSTGDAAQRLEDAAKAFEDEMRWLDLPRLLRRQADNCHAHLRPWAQVLRG